MVVCANGFVKGSYSTYVIYYYQRDYATNNIVLIIVAVTITRG